MAIFSKTSKAAISPAPTKAAAAGGYVNGTANITNIFDQYYNFQEGESRRLAMSVPALSRARDLMASVISCMPLRMYNMVWDENEERMFKKYIAPRSWLRQPDPQNTYSHFMSWVFDDLYFYGRSIIHISSRTADNYPATMQRLPVGSITSTDQIGPVWYAPSKEIYFNGVQLDPADLIQVLSPTTGIVYTSPQAIDTALKIQEARSRNASSAIPAGVLQIQSGEALTQSEMESLAAAFNAARAVNQTAVLSQELKYEATTMTPDKMLLMESANYSALECGSRIGNVPPYLIGVSTGSYSYQSSQQARADLYIFGVKLYAEAISATLSMNNVLPNGTYVEFDSEGYLEENYVADQMDMPEPNTGEELAS